MNNLAPVAPTPAEEYAEAPHLVTQAWLADQRRYLVVHEEAQRALVAGDWKPAARILGLVYNASWVCAFCGDGEVLRVTEQAMCGCGTFPTPCGSLAEGVSLMAAATEAQRQHVALLINLLA